MNVAPVIDAVNADTIAVTVNHSRHHLDRDQLTTALLLWWYHHPTPHGRRLNDVAHQLRREQGIDLIRAWILARGAEVCDRHNIEP